MKYHLNMSLQEWFDTLVAKRLEMTTKCTNDKGHCFYLDEKTGNRCLIGYFIPDEHQPQYLFGGANNILDQIPELFGCTDTDLERFKYFLSVVQQELHDANDVEAFSSPAYVCSLEDPLQIVCELFSLQLPDCYKEYVQKVAEEKTKMTYHLEMTLQQWLDALVAKRLEMTAKCADDNGVCFYLDDVTGNRCLIGYFLPDKHTATSIPGNIEKVMNLFPDLFSCTDRPKEEFINFLVEAQNGLHDNNDATKFSDKEYVLDQCTRTVDFLCTIYKLTIPDCLVEYKQKVEGNPHD